MNKIKKLAYFTFIYVVAASIVSIISISSIEAHAETIEENGKQSINNETAEPAGLYTNLSLNLGGNDGVIYATAKNTFTLFTSTINAYLYLYSSNDFQKSYADMDCVAYQYTYDLDMGDSITVSASTNGEQKYWQA